MGKALQIRVSAVTWNEDLLEELWPQLTELAFSVPIQHEKRGVLEMVRALDEGLTFMKWSKNRQDVMGPGIRGGGAPEKRAGGGAGRLAAARGQCLERSIGRRAGSAGAGLYSLSPHPFSAVAGPDPATLTGHCLIYLIPEHCHAE